jgi:VanZ family protein
MRGSRGWVLAAGLCALVIFIAGVLPTHPVLAATAGDAENAVASSGHFVEYAVLAFLLAVAVDGWRLSLRALAWSALGAVTLGWAVELVQAPLPYRDFQIADGLTDMAGVLVGLAAFSVAALARASRRPTRRG